MRLSRAGLVVLLVACLFACAPRREIATGAPPTEAPTPVPAIDGGGSILVLATTTSTQDSGLLDVLVPLFERQANYQVRTVSVGTGAALALGARGEADVLLVHAPQAEEQWMADGNGTERWLVMHNDFIFVGPPGDPGQIRSAGSAVDALRQIAERQKLWVSRDDGSGTDQLEKQLWAAAGLSPKGEPWYILSGQGMGSTLTLTDQKNAYTITDRGTYLARRDTLASAIHVEGDPRLLNIYHVITVNPAKFPGLPINTTGARAFAEFMVRPATQQLIRDYGRAQYGQPLFFPDAGKSEAQLMAN